ncbi:MAG: fructose-6-phosphate aldolase [Lachnospiraceae bacterium]|nr:fructose-6-phosphate aldolase [Lachnospiraceae bacterium]
MKLYIDDADTKKIRELMNYLPIDGITTNPTIIARSARPPFEVLREIREIIGHGRDLHVEVLRRDCEGMIEEAHRILRILGDDTYIKIPVTPDGYRAIRALSEEGVRVTATAILSPMQAFLAAKAGASFVAPYVNRIDEMGYDGEGVALSIREMLAVHEYPCEVLAASFKNSMQIKSLCEEGIECVTAPPDVLEALIFNPSTDVSVDRFEQNFRRAYGEDATMLTVPE